MAKKKIVIIGAGLAGLAAACKLIDKNFDITLLESREIIGGKVSSWKDCDGDWIESGLHVFFGAYQKIFELMQQVGIYENISWQIPSIQYRKPGGMGFQIISNEYLPSPFNLLPNFFFSHQFSIPDLLKYCRAIIPVLQKDLNYIAAQDQKTFLEWVNEFGLSKSIVENMFLPMTLSLKFLPAKEISAQVVLNVFRLFITNPKGFKIGFLNGAPHEKLTGPIANYLTERGVSLKLNKKVYKLEKENAKLKAVITIDGERFESDYFIFALPTHKFKEILTPYLEDLRFFANLKNFNGVPVANAQFWLDKPIIQDKRLHFGTAGLTPVFADMSLACADYKTKNSGSLIETVIAPFKGLENLSDAEILKRAWLQIQSYFPKRALEAKILKSTLVRIPQSVYAPYPGLEKLRPTQKTPIVNLFLAGGFTSGHEFFDSMEGAVQSGFLAAQEIVNFNN